MSRKSLDRDYQRRHRTGTAKGMKRYAEQTQCPACGRKSALRRREWVGFVLVTCRWCPHEDGHDIERTQG